jgi:hypothetical protein
MTLLYRWMALSLLLAGSCPSVADQVDKSYTTVSFRPDSLKVMVAIDEADLLAFLGLDQNGDQLLDRGELLAGVPRVFPLVEAHLQLEIDQAPVALRRVKADVGTGSDGTSFLNLYLSSPLEEPAIELDLQADFFTGFTEGHRNLTTILVPGRPVVTGVFSREVTRQRFVVGERLSWWEAAVRAASGWLGSSSR